jgi:hypothetical protein
VIATDVARALFEHWLQHNGTALRVVSIADAGVASSAEPSIAVETTELPPVSDAAWSQNRDRLQELVGEGLPVPAVVWAPPGAPLPTEEPMLSEFVDLTRRALVRLGPHERSHVAFPATLSLRKNSEDGSVITVSGGLNQHWAKFTGRVNGAFDLDSRPVHRLPDSEEYTASLIDRIVERANKMVAGEVASVEAEDCWTVQGLSGSPGVAIAGLPPGAATEGPTTLRRDFRRNLVDAMPRLRACAADYKALVVLCHLAHIEQEGITTALRGYDPGLYGGIDYICVVADGQVKAIVRPAD